MATTEKEHTDSEKRYIGEITRLGNSQGLYIKMEKLDEGGLEIGDQVVVDVTDRDDVAGLELLKLDDVLHY